MFRPPAFQICRLDMIGQYNALKCTACWQWNFERVAFGLIRYRTDESEIRPSIVGSLGNDQGWTPTGLFVPGLWVEIYFDEITGLRYARLAHQTSLPLGLPQSVSL